MPDLSTLLLFMAAAGIVVAIPGPNHLYIITRSVSQGRSAGLASAAGIETGTLVHIAAAALGLSSIIASSALAFSVIKYAGAAYLIYLGLRTLLRRPNPLIGRSDRGLPTRCRRSTAKGYWSMSSTRRSPSSSWRFCHSSSTPTADLPRCRSSSSAW